MIGIKTYSYRDREGFEKGIIYLSKRLHASHNLDKFEEYYFPELVKLFESINEPHFDHYTFLSYLSNDMEEYVSNLELTMHSFEGIKRSCEVARDKILDQFKSMISYIKLLRKKNDNPDLEKLYLHFIVSLENSLVDEREYLKKLIDSYNKVRINNKYFLSFKLNSKCNLRHIMAEQGHDFRVYNKEKKIYTKFMSELEKLNQFKVRFDSDDYSYEKQSEIKKIKSDFEKLMNLYQKHFSFDFEIDSEITFNQFKEIETLPVIEDFLNKVLLFYTKSQKAELKSYFEGTTLFKEIKSSLTSIRRSKNKLSEWIKDIYYWSQNDFKDEKYFLKKLEDVNSNNILDISDEIHYDNSEVKVDRLDESTPCYYLRHYLVGKKDGEIVKKLHTSALIGSCPNVIKKIVKLNSGDSDSEFGFKELIKIIPTQIYMPNITINEFSDNTLIQFPYQIQKFYDGLDDRKVDIIGMSSDIDLLRDKIFYSVYQKIDEKSNSFDLTNINDEINFIKVTGEYDFKSLEQVGSNLSMGKSGLKVIQKESHIELYLDDKLVKRLSLKSKKNNKDLLKSVKKLRGHKKTFASNDLNLIPINPDKSDCGISDCDALSFIIHYKDTNIWLDPISKPIERLSENKINPDKINAVMLSNLDEHNCSGLASLLEYKKLNSTFLGLISTKRIYDQVVFKFAGVFERNSDIKLKDFLKPIIIPDEGAYEINDFYFEDVNGDKVKIVDQGLLISFKSSFNDIDSLAIKMGFEDKIISIVKEHVIKHNSYEYLFDEILKDLNLDKYTYEHIENYDQKVIKAIWSIGASLRQRSLTDTNYLIHSSFSQTAVQNLIDLEIPIDSIARLNQNGFIKKYSERILDWCKSADFDWFIDSDVIIHGAGIYPKSSYIDTVFELFRYVRSFTESENPILILDFKGGLNLSVPHSLKNAGVLSYIKQEIKGLDIITDNDLNHDLFK